MATEESIREFAEQIVEQMSELDIICFDRHLWREGVGNLIAGSSGTSVQDADVEEVLDAIECAIARREG